MGNNIMDVKYIVHVPYILHLIHLHLRGNILRTCMCSSKVRFS